MKSHAQAKHAGDSTGDVAILIKFDPTTPALFVDGPSSVKIKSGTRFAGVTFDKPTDVAPPLGGYEPGGDYAVLVSADGTAAAVRIVGLPDLALHLGGFHFAPGGNAPARAGGDEVPQVNPHSIWDWDFRPACPDPRGMTLVQAPFGKFWCDIYLLGTNHLTDGTSRFGACIADGNDLPGNPAGGTFRKFDYAAATAVMKHHGKGLPSLEEFFAAAFGVTEKTAHDGDPRMTDCDPARTSKWGLMQATGNMWAWGHDGDPDEPRPSLFGGSWFDDVVAGSRYAFVGYWAGHSDDNLGARGRSDHLQPASS